MVKIKNMNKNAPPPYIPAIYGNFHIAPNPIAEPALARIKPVDVFQCEWLLKIPTPFKALKCLNTQISLYHEFILCAMYL